METTTYRIDNEGRFFREYLNSQEIEVTEAVAKAFQQTQPLIAIPYTGSITSSDGREYETGVKYDPNTSLAYWSVKIPEIMLTTAFHPVSIADNTILVPKFKYDARDKTEVVMSVPWVVPVDTHSKRGPRVVLVVTVDGQLISGKQYLFAFDEKGAAYRMPMSNIYGTCELCCGDFNRRGVSHMECVYNAIEQFRKGQWNSDLFDPEDDATASKFFRFAPLKEGFQTLDIEGKWTDHCQKVSTPTVKYAL
jgi:hypothetical protein